MTLTAADVAEIMRIVEQSAFDELSLEIDGIKLTLRRTGAAGEMTHSVTTPSAHDGAAAAVPFASYSSATGRALSVLTPRNGNQRTLARARLILNFASDYIAKRPRTYEVQ